MDFLPTTYPGKSLRSLDLDLDLVHIFFFFFFFFFGGGIYIVWFGFSGLRRYPYIRPSLVFVKHHRAMALKEISRGNLHFV